MAVDAVPKPTPKSVEHIIRQSPPIDLSTAYDPKWMKDRVVLITGGATGFGAGFIRLWAANGATIIMGDINIDGGMKLAAEVNASTGRKAVHFVHANVLDWQSLVSFFKKAVELSPHGGIDTVVANAGIAGPDGLCSPQGLDAASPPPPNLRIYEINSTGLLWTIHLAFFWLPKNPGSNRHVDLNQKPGSNPRDRSILLLGSMASLGPFPPQPQYNASKHAVLGVFRAVRGTSFIKGIRINMLCPYFIDTPIIPFEGRLALAGGAMGKPEDVVDAGTRLVADQRINGRALIVGPRLKMHTDKETGEVSLLRKDADVPERAIWEALADDWDETELVNRNFLNMLNTVEAVRGWTGFVYDIAMTFKWAITTAIFGKK